MIKFNNDYSDIFKEKFLLYLHDKFNKGEIPFLFFDQTHIASVFPFGRKAVIATVHETDIIYSNDEETFDKLFDYLVKMGKGKHTDLLMIYGIYLVYEQHGFMKMKLSMGLWNSYTFKLRDMNANT